MTPPSLTTEAPSHSTHHRIERGGVNPRPARYLVLSIITGGIAQLGLIVAYAGFGWDPTAAVLFSLAVSVGPSYWGSRTYVWAGLSRHRMRTEVVGFMAIAVIGSATAIGLTHAAVGLGHLLTHDRNVLAIWASAGSISATVVVWIARYFALDRWLFPSRQRS